MLVFLYLGEYRQYDKSFTVRCSLWNYIEIVCDYRSIQFVVLSNKQ